MSEKNKQKVKEQGKNTHIKVCLKKRDKNKKRTWNNIEQTQFHK